MPFSASQGFDPVFPAGLGFIKSFIGPFQKRLRAVPADEGRHPDTDRDREGQIRVALIQGIVRLGDGSA